MRGPKNVDPARALRVALLGGRNAQQSKPPAQQRHATPEQQAQQNGVGSQGDGGWDSDDFIPSVGNRSAGRLIATPCRG